MARPPMRVQHMRGQRLSVFHSGMCGRRRCGSSSVLIWQWRLLYCGMRLSSLQRHAVSGLAATTATNCFSTGSDTTSRWAHHTTPCNRTTTTTACVTTIICSGTTRTTTELAGTGNRAGQAHHRWAQKEHNSLMRA